MVRGVNGMCGLNIVGLRRAGLSSAERTELKTLYRHLFRGRLLLREAVETARREFTSECARTLIDFVATSQRGLCADTGRRR